MINHRPQPQQLYTVDRPASPLTFAGYRECLEEIRAQLTSTGGPQSYWIIGEPKSGKSSFLLKMEDLLRKDAEPKRSHLRPVPLYVSCASCDSLWSLCQSLLQRLAAAAPSRPGTALSGPAAASRLEPSWLPESKPPVAVKDLLALLWKGLAAAATQLDGNLSPIVLLIDDLDSAMEKTWGRKLFQVLKALLTEAPAEGATSADLAVALAGSPDLASVPQFADLLGPLDIVNLRPLRLRDVGDLIRASGRAVLNGHLAEAVLRATGGQPWLTQLVLALFTEAHLPEREFSNWFKTFDWVRLRGNTDHQQVLARWLSCLPEGGFTILALLTLARKGMTLREIAEATHLDDADVAPRLGKMVGLGLIYQPEQRPDTYQVCDVVMRCYLEASGGAVLLQEIDRLKGSSPGSSLADFCLLLSLEHRVMVADGLYTRCFALDNRFTDEAQSLYRSARKATTAQDLEDLGQRLEDLGRNYVDENWLVTWEDYFDGTDRQLTRFIMQTGDQELLDFPIELLPFEHGFLGLRVPTFKEIIGLRRRQQPYRLAAGCLPRDEPLNVLLVGAAAGGKYGNGKLPALPGVGPEIVGICQALQVAAKQGTLSLGRIVVLSDAPDFPLDGVVVHQPTVEEMRQVLGNAAGPGFHVLHFSGHYAFGQSDQSSGLLIQGADGVDLFSLADLFQQLDGKKLRFACFNGCGSGNHLPQSPTHYLGAPYTCLRAGVPAVIGMRWPIDDAAARDLGIFFYQKLAASMLPEMALLETRKWAERRGGTLWAAPVMLTC
jgi:hypothetical protein